MSEKVISPDLGFVNDVISSGGGTLKKCFQCATCSVVCNVTPEDNPFPRKEMVHAQWGLKDQLFGNPDIWLCHQCSDCTAHCPRGAKPGEVLGTIRQMSLERYSAPRFLARMLRDPKFLVFLLAVPVVILMLVLAVKGNTTLDAIPRGEGGKIVYSEFIPTSKAIDPIFMAAMFFAVAMLARGVVSYWKDMARQNPVSGGLGGAIVPALVDILSHSRFRKCGVTVQRGTTHMFVFYSFVGLAVTTSMAAFYVYVRHIESPYGLMDPVKLIGNLSAIVLAVGIVLVITNRMATAPQAGMGGYYDWLFIGVIVAIAATGILSEVFRLMNVAPLAYPTYFVHLVTVFFLFAYAPYSKMAHMVYRATAMVFSRAAGRER